MGCLGSPLFFRLCADGWSGAGNIATLNADGQEFSGIIKVGDDSQLTLNLTNGSTFTDSIDGVITNAKGETVSTEIGTVNVKCYTERAVDKHPKIW